ncbi:YceI family protein [Trabulsiella odontotermitis]|uniref:YceI family protein n=1 Tax=Trabulsiella odontotermitis TaxID=379893 RepID=UPI0006BA6457|nr:YceI family protein [Trabulsiella odontotermitis]
MTRVALIIAPGLLMIPLSLHANPVSYRIDTQKTSIALLWHAFGGVSQARLEKVTGDITLDDGNERDDHINVTIPVSTLKASNGLLTYQMKSRFFFDADRYPNIAFTSSRVVAMGKGRFRVFGTLAVKDVTREVILNASLEETQGEVWGRQQISLNASTTISRSAFNMESFAALVDDAVLINIEIQAQPRLPV